MLFRLLAVISLTSISANANLLKKNNTSQLIQSFGVQNTNAINSLYGSVDKASVINSVFSNIYFEYGLRDSLNIGINTRFAANFNNDNPVFKGNQAGVDYVEIFMRQKLFEYQKLFISGKALIKFPGFYESKAPNQMFNNQRDYEVSLEFGYGVDQNLYQRNMEESSDHFFITALRYRIKDKINVHETRIEFTYGYRVLDSVLFLFDFQKINFLNETRISNPQMIFTKAGINITNFDPFQHQGIMKIQISIASKIADGYYFQVGAYKSFHNSLFQTNNHEYNILGFFGSIWMSF